MARVTLVVVDRTVACSTSGVHEQAPFSISANAAVRKLGHLFPAGASVQSGQTALVAFAIGLEVSVDSDACAPSHTSVPLTPLGLGRATSRRV